MSVPRAPCLFFAGLALFLFPPGSTARAAPAAVPPTRADAVPKAGDAHKPAHKPDPLADAEAALRVAPGDAEARSLEAKAEGLRQRRLQAVVRLLVAHAEKALVNHDFHAAERAASDAIVLQPDQPILRRERAGIRFAAGDFDGAIADLGVALQGDAGDVVAWKLLAEVEAGRHDYKAAVDAIDHAAALDPHLRGFAEQRRKLVLQRDGQPT